MPTPPSVQELIHRFERNIEAYRSGQYNETQVRLEFVDPFFKALGWDIHNEKGYAEAYKDVIHEESVKIGGATKAPDYSFRIGGVRKFFVETKKPSVNLKVDASPAFQLRRYAWSAKLPLSILTDFEELIIYDCRVKPMRTDSASNARVMYMTYKEYETRWDELSEILSRDAVLKGSFDKFAESTKAKKGTALVDDTFLDEIDSWRDMLARNIALRNPKLTQRELNYAVQVTIDRIIFLRICEDRGIEEYGRLMALQNGTNMYKRLVELFYRADERYNSGLFHFQSEKDRPTPVDELTPGLAIDDNVLVNILKRLYYPESPYEFSVLSADILGQVYEQFLGKVIRLTEGHQAKIEPKPEVKKAGGVYYTPTYIVEYIVKNTVGRLLDEDPRRPELGSGPVQRIGAETSSARQFKLTPKQASKLRILDPACGSGSFLLGAYQYLLDWHLQWYVADGPEKHSKELYEAPGGLPAEVPQGGTKAWRLTTAERKRILLNNIYGVDIDPQAVEVTKLSLLLKVLEGENDQTLSRQLKLIHERALPDLGSNIKCGNSLIGPDFYEGPPSSFGLRRAGKQLNLLDEEERMRINVFDWEKEFPEIMKAGGPVRRSPDAVDRDEGGFDAVIGNPPYGVQFRTNEKQYLQVEYKTSLKNNNSFVMFFERAINLAKTNGVVGYIIPNTFLTGDNYFDLRVFLLNHNITQLVKLPYDIFGEAYIDTCIAIIKKESFKNDILVADIPAKVKIQAVREMEEYQKAIDKTPWKLTVKKTFVSNPVAATLQEKLSRTKCVVLEEICQVDRGTLPPSKTTNSKVDNRDIFYWFDGQIYRYLSVLTLNRKIKCSDLKEFKTNRMFLNQRILLRQLISRQFRLNASIVEGPFAFKKNLYCIYDNKSKLNLKYILGILNSKLFSYLVYNSIVGMQRDDFPSLSLKDARDLPIRWLDLTNEADKSRHDRMVVLVEQMLELHKQFAAAKTEHEKTALQRQIYATDGQIDNLVYEVYALTEEEIKIVEGV